ncbi:hypothetical protein EDD15DRAFT_2200936 [Pisolithus albus]|nr:hypothetical protein EDD15DRAFT_2200936 [Pisolithus albus]
MSTFKTFSTDAVPEPLTALGSGSPGTGTPIGNDCHSGRGDIPNFTEQLPPDNFVDISFLFLPVPDTPLHHNWKVSAPKRLSGNCHVSLGGAPHFWVPMLTAGAARFWQTQPSPHFVAVGELSRRLIIPLNMFQRFRLHKITHEARTFTSSPNPAHKTQAAYTNKTHLARTFQFVGRLDVCTIPGTFFSSDLYSFPSNGFLVNGGITLSEAVKSYRGYAGSFIILQNYHVLTKIVSHCYHMVNHGLTDTCASGWCSTAVIQKYDTTETSSWLLTPAHVCVLVRLETRSLNLTSYDISAQARFADSSPELRDHHRTSSTFTSIVA